MKKIIIDAFLALIPLAFAGLAHGSIETRKPPASCVRALNDAEQLAGTELQLSKDVAAFFQTVQQSARAHSAGTIEDVTVLLNDITSAEQTLTAKANGLTSEVNAIGAKHRPDKAACLAGR